MQARYRSVKERILNGAAFCGGKYIRAFFDSGSGCQFRHPFAAGC
ncbi:hypothetical protein BSLA_02f0833 [Burkholderia stabilis]|nr:hypothetical protein BSLA_02f0833 [Burkholderia stabilis]